MGKVEENKKQKKDLLLKTAFRLFTEKGFSKTTISDIVQEAGLAKGTFYLYFQDKYAILVLSQEKELMICGTPLQEEILR